MWIARDKNETLSFFVIRPVRYGDNWIESDASPSMQDSCTLPKLMYSEVKWEDEPIEVELYGKSEKLSLIADVIDYCQRFGSNTDCGTIYEFLYAKVNEK